MIPRLLEILTTFAGTLLALVAFGAVAIWALCRWADADELAERSCDNVDGGA